MEGKVRFVVASLAVLAVCVGTGSADAAPGDLVTNQVADRNPGNGSFGPDAMVRSGNNVIFYGFEPATGFEAYTSDGNSITLIEDGIPGGGIYPGAGDSFADYFMDVGGTTYFQADDSVNGYELWKYGGSGTASMIEDSVAGGGIRPGSASSDAKPLGSAGGTAYFTADDGANGTEVWQTTGGTATMLQPAGGSGGINPGAGTGSSPASGMPSGPGGSLRFFRGVNGAFYFSADDGTNGRELWKATGDGTATMIQSPAPGDAGINPGGSSNPSLPTEFNGALYFKANDGRNTRLYRYGGSGDATEVLGVIPGGNNPDISGLTAIGGALYIAADEGTEGQELYRWDGTGTATLVDDADPAPGIRPGTEPAGTADLTDVNGTIFFSAVDGSHGAELWKLTGPTTAALVKDIDPGDDDMDTFPDNSLPQRLVSFNGNLFFSADDGVAGRELWKSDGTAAGTAMVSDITLGPLAGNPRNITPLDNLLLFSATELSSGTELWKVSIEPAPVAPPGVTPTEPLKTPKTKRKCKRKKHKKVAAPAKKCKKKRKG